MNREDCLIKAASAMAKLIAANRQLEEIAEMCRKARIAPIEERNERTLAIIIAIGNLRLQ